MCPCTVCMIIGSFALVNLGLSDCEACESQAVMMDPSMDSSGQMSLLKSQLVEDS